MLQQAKPTGEAGNPRGGAAVLARSSLSPSETGPPSHKQAGKDGGEKPEKKITPESKLSKVLDV